MILFHKIKVVFRLIGALPFMTNHRCQDVKTAYRYYSRMKTKNKPVDVWGMESNVQIPVRIYADGKLILCSRKQKMKDDVEYVSMHWLMQTLKECLADSPDIFGRISARLETNTI